MFAILIFYMGLELAFSILVPDTIDYGIEHISYLDQLQEIDSTVTKDEIDWWHHFIEANSYKNPYNSIIGMTMKLLPKKTSRQREEYTFRPHGRIFSRFDNNSDALVMRFRMFINNKVSIPKNMLSDTRLNEPPEVINILDKKCSNKQYREIEFPRIFNHLKIDTKNDILDYDFEYYWCDGIKSFLVFDTARISPVDVYVWHYLN